MHPSQCSLHALPGLQREARHAAGERSQLWKGRIQNSTISGNYRILFFFLNAEKIWIFANPKKIIPPSEFSFTVAWGGAGGGAAAGTSPAAPCEAAGALCLCIGHLISSQRRCAFVCSHNPEKFLSLAALSHSLALWTAAPNPPTQPTLPGYPPPLGSSCRKILKKRRGLD